MGWFSDIFEMFTSNMSLLFSEFKFNDLVDIILIAFLIFEVLLLVRRTRASQIAKGIIIILVAYGLASLFELRTMRFILQAIISWVVVVLAVIFQPELRRAVESVGGVDSLVFRLFRPPSMSEARRTKWQTAIVAVCDAAERMAEERTGALMVLERHSNLTEILRTGTALHSEVNIEILTTIFYEGTALHDGAVVIRDGELEAAGCFLPLSNNLEIGKDLGTRHRAALGLAENADAVVVVVSEESGIISLAKSGVMIRRLDRQNLFNLLISEIIPPEPQHKKKRFSLKSGKGRQHEEERG